MVLAVVLNLAVVARKLLRARVPAPVPTFLLTLPLKLLRARVPAPVPTLLLTLPLNTSSCNLNQNLLRMPNVVDLSSHVKLACRRCVTEHRDTRKATNKSYLSSWAICC